MKSNYLLQSKLNILLFIGISALLVLAPVFPSKAATNKTTPPSAASSNATSNSAIPKRTIKFATEATYPPFVTMDPNGKIGGFETELVQAICQEANLNCEFYHRPFDSLFPNLSLKKIDAVYGCVGITEERKSQVLFSKPLYHSPTGFIFSVSNPLTLDNESFQGKTIALQQGATGYEKYLKKHYPNAKLKSYASIQDALMDLKIKRVHAVFGDSPVFHYWLNNKKKAESKDNETKTSTPNPEFATLEIPKEHVSEFSQGTAIAVRLEDAALINSINEAYDKLIKEGKFNVEEIVSSKE